MRTFHSLYFILSKVLRLLILKRDAAVKYFKCNLSFLCASHNAICLYDARVQKLFFWSLVLSQGLRRGTPWTGRQLTQRQTHIHNYGNLPHLCTVRGSRSTQKMHTSTGRTCRCHAEMSTESNPALINHTNTRLVLVLWTKVYLKYELSVNLLNVICKSGKIVIRCQLIVTYHSWYVPWLRPTLASLRNWLRISNKADACLQSSGRL